MHRRNMHCIKVATKNVWDPFSIEDELTVPRLTRVQLRFIFVHFKGSIPVTFLHSKFGIWVG